MKRIIAPLLIGWTVAYDIGQFITLDRDWPTSARLGRVIWLKLGLVLYIVAHGILRLRGLESPRAG
jgi:hypothetical protein